MKDISELLKIIVTTATASSAIVGVYYLLTNILFENWQILKPKQNDLTRLMYDLYSTNKIKKNTFYLTLVVLSISTLLSLYISNGIIGFIAIFIIILLLYLIYIRYIEKQRAKKILTIKYEKERWYLLLRTEEGYVFSKQTNLDKNDLNSLVFLKKEKMMEYFLKYSDLKNLDSI